VRILVTASGALITLMPMLAEAPRDRRHQSRMSATRVEDPQDALAERLSRVARGTSGDSDGALVPHTGARAIRAHVVVERCERREPPSIRGGLQPGHGELAGG
jgi:hypothetical protein